jgi:hypothetical protein
MVRHPEPKVSRTRRPESLQVLHEVFLLARLQDHRIEQARRICLNIIPAFVIHVEVRSYPRFPVVTRDNFIHKALEHSLVPTDGSKRQRFKPPLASALRVFAAIKPDPERKPRMCQKKWRPGAGINAISAPRSDVSRSTRRIRVSGTSAPGTTPSPKRRNRHHP